MERVEMYTLESMKYDYLTQFLKVGTIISLPEVKNLPQVKVNQWWHWNLSMWSNWVWVMVEHLGKITCLADALKQNTWMREGICNIGVVLK